MPNPSQLATITFVDSSSEVTRFQLYPKTTLVEHFVSPGALPTDSVTKALLDAIALISDAVIVRRTLTTVLRVQNLEYAPAGQREEKMLITYEDATTKELYSVEMPARKPNLPRITGTDRFDLTVAPFSTFVTALQNAALSPNGNPIIVRQLRLVGRNL